MLMLMIKHLQLLFLTWEQLGKISTSKQSALYEASVYFLCQTLIIETDKQTNKQTNH